ncbi:MAG: single-stranded DNA-binding protein [Thermoplasmata archaeon]|nr:MAG: single-stranded DNA-binding protein [Thermoplasmata archaeon]
MLSLNRWQGIGNLGQTPELRYTGSGSPVTNLVVATNRKYRSQEGETQQETTWHRITVFGKLAEACCEHLQKGDQVYVEGRLQTRQWEGKDGTKRHTTEIVASRIDFGNRTPRD